MGTVKTSRAKCSVCGNPIVRQVQDRGTNGFAMFCSVECKRVYYADLRLMEMYEEEDRRAQGAEIYCWRMMSHPARTYRHQAIMMCTVRASAAGLTGRKWA